MEKEYLKIGEIASLFGLDVQTLHYYDRIGLFKPAYRDQRTGYRLYRFDQIYQLAFIRYMRKLGYSIEDVQTLQDERHPQSTIQMLKERSRSLKETWEELMKTDHAIMKKVLYVEEGMQDLDVDALSIQEIPERKMIRIGTKDEVYLEDSYYFYPTVVFYEDNHEYFCALVDEEDAREIAPEDLGVIPAGRYLVGYHEGPYETIEQRFAQMQAAYPDYTYSPAIVTLNIIDQFVEKDKEKYITAIQMRILS